MKIFKRVLLSFVVLIALFVILIEYKSNDKDVLISGYESFYLEEQTNENLNNLCNELYGYTDYERILVYYPLYIENDVAYNQIIQSGGTDFLARKHSDSFKIDYCFVLLHSSKYKEFEDYFNKLKDTVSDINFIYYFLSTELETREYTEKQLSVLLDSLKELEDDSLKKSKRTYLSNLSLQSTVYGLLNDMESYLDLNEKIEREQDKLGVSTEGGIH